MTSMETDLLADLIGRKRDCLVQLRDMGLRQFELVQEGSMTELLEVLAVKQRVLFALQKVERSLEPFRGQSPESRHWRSPEARVQTARRLDECEALLGEILKREKQSEQELIRRRDETAAQLQGVHAAGRARGAYLSPFDSAPAQLDLSSET